MRRTRVCRRLATAALTLWGVTAIVFGLIQLAPGSPLGGGEMSGGMRLPPEAVAKLRQMYRLDEPVHRGYVLWLGDVVRGDLGRSLHDRRPVADKILERLGVTLALNASALALTLALALPLGAAAALRPGTAWDRWPTITTWVLYSIPVFWAALLLQLLFAVELEWLPLAGVRSPNHDLLGPWERLFDRSSHLILPIVCLTYGSLAYVSRFVRTALLDNAAAEGWRAARARGASFARTLVLHGIRQAAIPLLTLAGFLLPALVAGSVVVETVFALPGLGRLFVDAAFDRDAPVLMGLTLLSASVAIAGILGADLASAIVDPRLRRE